MKWTMPSFIGGAMIIVGLVMLHYAFTGNLASLTTRPLGQSPEGGQPGATKLE